MATSFDDIKRGIREKYRGMVMTLKRAHHGKKEHVFNASSLALNDRDGLWKATSGCSTGV